MANPDRFARQPRRNNSLDSRLWNAHTHVCLLAIPLPMPYTSAQRIAGIFAWFIVCLATFAVCISVYRLRAVGDDAWYNQLLKPDWVPSVTSTTWIWLCVFVTQAVAVWHVWVQREEHIARLGVRFFTASLVLTGIWMIIYYGFMNPYCGVIQVVIVWMACMATVSLFWQRSKFAGTLLVPGFLWITFSGYLNFVIWRMNA